MSEINLRINDPEQCNGFFFRSGIYNDFMFQEDVLDGIFMYLFNFW